MKLKPLAVLLGLLSFAGSAYAATTLEYLFTDGYPLAVSADGNAIAGNNPSNYGPFRWTRSGGRVDLGMASAPITGGSAGIPGISANGLRVASTIVGPDSTYSTQGLWTQGSGWQFLMPPMPPGGHVQDKDMGSIWGLSGDGLTAVGLFWSPGRGHACSWTQATGAVDLGSLASNLATRANGVNFNGSVIVGWAESPTFGYRTPAAWVNGQLTALAPDIIGEAQCVTQDGQVAGGFQRDDASNLRQACFWRRTGNSWGPVELLGYVPGSTPGYALNVVEGISADASLAVGYCSFSGDPYNTTGFVWTPEDGVVDVVQFLANAGILPDPSFSITSLTCMTPDGTKLVGYGHDTLGPGTTRAFMIHLDRTAAVRPSAAVASSLQLAASPNPVRTGTTFSFDLPRAAPASLTVQDASGRTVRRVVSATLEAGHHQFAWDGRDDAGSSLPSGMYFSHLVAGNEHVSRKLVLFH